MELEQQMRIIRLLKILMFGAFAASVFRIAWRTWKYGGAKEIREDTFDFAEDPEEPEIQGVG
jgi:hypothetical protein